MKKLLLFGYSLLMGISTLNAQCNEPTAAGPLAFCGGGASIPIEATATPSTVTYTLVMNDSWGDGWNGNTFTITDSLGWTYFSTTLASGSFGTDSVCLSPNICYIVTCGGGSFTSEVSWNLTSDVTGGIVLSGGRYY